MSLITIQTDHFMNKIVTTCFSNGTKSELININNYNHNNNNTIATYGILRGTGDLIKKSRNFYYLDHGYVSSSSRNFTSGKTVIDNMSGYFRIVHNDLIGFKIKPYNDERIKKLNINFSPKRKSGDYIIVSEPSSSMINFFNFNNWVDNTIKQLRKHTDRKIYIHNKYSKIPLEKLLSKAWAFVSFQSTAGFKSMINGVPAHFTHKLLREVNSIENIENGNIDYDVFKSLSYNQWTLEEIKNGIMNDQYNF